MGELYAKVESAHGNRRRATRIAGLREGIAHREKIGVGYLCGRRRFLSVHVVHIRRPRTSLALGLPRLGLALPRVALDPCGGDGALRRCLAPFGVDAQLSDLYREMYPTADGYVTRQPLGVSDR